MKVDKHSRYRLIFSIKKHPQLGALIEPVVIAVTSRNTLSLTYQKVFSGSADYYTRLSKEELELISLLDPVMVERIIKKFHPELRVRPKEYFHKHFDKDRFKAEMRPFIETHLLALLKRLDPAKHLLYVADDINPAADRVEITQEFSKVLYHFRKNEFGTRYFATIKYKDQRVPFMKVGALLLSNQPAFLVVQGKLLRFYDFVEGNKLAVFLNRKFIQVKPDQEKEYYQQFVRKLMERSPVFADGFEVEYKQYDAKAILKVIGSAHHQLIQLQFSYGDFVFDYHPSKHQHVALKWNGDEPHFTKVRRARAWEDNRAAELVERGMEYIEPGRFKVLENQEYAAVHWLAENTAYTEERKYEILFDRDIKYDLNIPKISYKVSDKFDWFDLNINVRLGDFEFPFKKLLPSIRNGERNYTLPNGSVFIIPQEWFALGEDLQRTKRTNKGFQVEKYQLDILSHIKSKKIREHLNKIESIKEEQVSKKFQGTLRPYQIDGLSWLMFLYRNGFGGILADDMGLGKTVQTLAFLQKILEEQESPTQILLVAPTSLLYNWQNEAQKFTPDLNTYVHTGGNRLKRRELFQDFDLIITSYGLMRNDHHIFSEEDFLCIVLDESQYIKNQSAKSTQLINKLKSRHKLCLTGTPIENSIKDLWSQMNFLNKGLLRSARAFEQEFVKAIEKDQDRTKAEELKKLVKPFVLRRTKQQVAKDLPALTEKVVYCQMSEEQKNMYEEVKSEYRNELFQIGEEKKKENKLSILQGLTKLRLMADHPVLLEEEYSGDSGKHQSILEHIQTAVDEDHKVLVFSQFVSYLSILERDLKTRGIPYLLLTGSVSSMDRKKRVKEFQEGHEYPVFLISLKAGGVGLNLTAADYVFITDPWWNPATEAQARDRTHRIGQKNSVISYKFISTDTVEEKILKLQQRKKVIASDVIEIEENIMKNLKTEELQKLFE
ncbi:MAG: DEAD/DEAH box helicase [Bacteroidia bacterium]